MKKNTCTRNNFNIWKSINFRKKNKGKKKENKQKRYQKKIKFTKSNREKNIIGQHHDYFAFWVHQ